MTGPETGGVAVAAAAIDEAELRRRVARLSVEQKIRLLTGADFWALYPEPEAGLRPVVLSDGPAGVRGETWDERDTSANVPSPTALAATWDCERVEGIGRLLAHEARRKGVDVLLAPTVNLHRSPYGGRHFECFRADWGRLCAGASAGRRRGMRQALYLQRFRDRPDDGRRPDRRADAARALPGAI